MNKDEALRLALAALKNSWTEPGSKQYEFEEEAIDAIEAALEAKDEPVAGCQHKRYSVDAREGTGTCHNCGAEGQMQFVVGDTTPPQRTWVWLTDVEIQDLMDVVNHYNFPEDLITYTQDKLKEKNNG